VLNDRQFAEFVADRQQDATDQHQERSLGDLARTRELSDDYQHMYRFGNSSQPGLWFRSVNQRQSRQN
jgi:hypothetical protein